MDIHPWVWGVTVVVTSAVLLFDVVVVGRRPHEPSMRECARALALFVGAAILFGEDAGRIEADVYGALPVYREPDMLAALARGAADWGQLPGVLCRPPDGQRRCDAHRRILTRSRTR